MTGHNSQHIGSLDNLYGSLAPGQFYRRDGARLRGQTDPSLLKVSSQNAEFHEIYHLFDKAHVVMLARNGVISDEVAASLLLGLKEMEGENHIKIRQESGYGCHAGEAFLIDNLGEEIGGWIHIGRSTRDLREVGKRVVARNHILSLIEKCLDLCETYTHRAEEYNNAVMPTYTRVQHAQVSTFGFHLLSLERPIERDIQRLWNLYASVNESPAGAAAGTATDFSIDRSQTATLLGFETIADNATDVDKSSDIHLEGNFVPVILLHNIATATDQFLLWSSEEFGLVEIPDEFCGTSSIMPQKKNPLGLIKIKNHVKNAVGETMSQLVDSRSFGGRGNIAVPVFDAAFESVEIFNKILLKTTFDRERGEQLVTEDWALATDLTSLLVREAEIPWRSAHQIVAILCRQCIEENRTITDVQVQTIVEIAEEYLECDFEISEDGVEDVLSPTRAIRARKNVIGSPAKNQIADQIRSTEKFMLKQHNRLTSEKERLESAQKQLEEEIQDIISTADQ
ncbi:lyase family protein [Natrialbaceae archaeon A-chndr2]